MREGETVLVQCRAGIQNPWDKYIGEEFMAKLVEKDPFDDGSSHTVSRIDNKDWPRNNGRMVETLFAYQEFVKRLTCEKHRDFVYHKKRGYVCPWCEL